MYFATSVGQKFPTRQSGKTTKVLIWFLCIFCASIAQVLLKYTGISGAIPAVIIYGAMLTSARFLWKKYDEKRSKRTADKVTSNKHAVTRQSISCSEPQSASGYGAPLDEMHLEKSTQGKPLSRLRRTKNRYKPPRFLLLCTAGNAAKNSLKAVTYAVFATL